MKWIGGKLGDNNKPGLKNQYCIVDNSYVLVKLQDDFVMKCSIEDLPIVKERVWTYNKDRGKKTGYVKSRESVIRGQEYELFHRRITGYDEVDHINRDGLDNRRENLRDGSNYVNANNKSIYKNNTSGVTGVSEDSSNPSKARWRVQWSINGKRQPQESFSFSKYGGRENAYKAACEFRWEKDRKRDGRVGL